MSWYSIENFCKSVDVHVQRFCVFAATEEAAEGGEAKKRQKRGGKGQVKTKKKETAPTG